MTDFGTGHSADPQLQRALFALRLGVFIVMAVWTLDKFVQPEHAAGVFATFYKLPGLDAALFALIGAVQLVIVLAFAAGFMRFWSYGAVFLMHAVSTLSSWGRYMDAFDNLLFFAAWPMLAACYALFVLRHHDTLLSVDAARRSA